jgi:hypothetical protein
MEVLPAIRCLHRTGSVAPGRFRPLPRSADGPLSTRERGWEDAAVTAARIAVVAVWVLTLIGVAIIDVVVPDAHALTWLALALPLAIVAGIIGQLAVAEQRGFVLRLAATASGSFVLVLLGALVATLS